MEFFTGQPG